MSDSRPTPDLATVIADALGVSRRSLYTALPGRVESYDAATQTCSATPLVQDGQKDETGSRRPKTLPIVTSVPVAWLGGGGSSITSALAQGDEVLLVFASSAIDRWLALGGVVDPIDDRRHHLTDAFAIPCVRSLPNALGPTAVGSGLVLSSGKIQLGDSTATESAILGDSLVSALNTLANAMDVMFAVGSPPTGVLAIYASGIKAAADPTNAFTPALLTGLATLTTAILAFKTAIATVKSSIVKVKG